MIDEPSWPMKEDAISDLDAECALCGEIYLKVQMQKHPIDESGAVEWVCVDCHGKEQA